MRPSEMKSGERTYPFRMPKGRRPSHPAWSSTFAADQTGVAMAVIGFQHDAGTDPGSRLTALHEVLEGATIRDLVTSDAGGGLHETLCIAYWREGAVAAEILTSGTFTALWEKWMDAGDIGLIREYVNIPFERTETLFSTPDHAHGYSQMREGLAGPVEHHEYWGGMRDRIPLSAHDPLEAGGAVRVVHRDARRVVVEAHENLCIIRSGQDWSHCDAQQLAEYSGSIEPVLREGMAFLRDEGSDVNCYACRYLHDISLDGHDPKRSSGMAYFRTMKDLEDWAEHHPTHLRIFNTFLGIAPKHGPNLQLRLWHEVSVLPASGCRAEYVNCRPGTGWMPA